MLRGGVTAGYTSRVVRASTVYAMIHVASPARPRRVLASTTAPRSRQLPRCLMRCGRDANAPRNEGVEVGTTDAHVAPQFHEGQSAARSPVPDGVLGNAEYRSYFALGEQRCRAGGLVVHEARLCGRARFTHEGAFFVAHRRNPPRAGTRTEHARSNEHRLFGPPDPRVSRARVTGNARAIRPSRAISTRILSSLPRAVDRRFPREFQRSRGSAWGASRARSFDCAKGTYTT